MKSYQNITLFSVVRFLKKGGNNFLDIGGWNYLAYTAQSLNPMNFNVGTTAAVADAVSLSQSFRNEIKILINSYLNVTKALNPVWHGIGKQEKCSYLEQQRGNFYKT
jgi:hypothetical protein